MSESESAKTEEPTPRRLQRARDEGDSGVSSAFAQALSFAVALVAAPAVLTALASSSAATLRATFTHLPDGVPAGDAIARSVAAPVLAYTVPLSLAVGLVGAAATVLQTGAVVSFRRISPRPDRLDVVAGLGRLLTSQRAFAVARAVIAATLVAWISLRETTAHLSDIVAVTGRPTMVAPLTKALLVRIGQSTAAVLLVMGALDLMVSRRAWRMRLRMTRAEVERDQKESSGDPEMRAQRQRAYAHLTEAATTHDLKTATVVIVSGPGAQLVTAACALRYDENEPDAAPVVVATGQGDAGHEIVRAARAYNVPLVEDRALAAALVVLERSRPIPEEHFEAVAEVLRGLSPR